MSGLRKEDKNFKQMKIGKYIGFVVIVVMAACSGPKSFISLKNSAENKAAQGNYTQAVESWQQYFNQQPVEEIDGGTFANAAQSAFQAGKSELAVDWFDQARYKNFSSAEMYSTLAKIYQSQGNLSKELSALEFYAENYNENQGETNNRLFTIYYEIEMFDKALAVWEKLNEASKNELSNQEKFFQINLEKENTGVCDSVSLIILQKNPQNVDALEWNAKKFYWKAENRYQEEMEKYNKNKTTKQYRTLLNELDKVSTDFKKALPYFKKLWEMNPGEKYAGYMANIYARFGDEKKADYYKKFLN
jgi:tetratricopeptide (TPR) repeat protein